MRERRNPQLRASQPSLGGLCLVAWLLLSVTHLGWAEKGRQVSDVSAAPQVTVKERVGLTCVLRGQQIALTARAVAIQGEEKEEYLVVADAPELGQIAAAFGATVEWHPSSTTLVCHRAGGAATVRLGQERFPDVPAGRPLLVAPRVLDGAVHVPLSILEDFLGVRLTHSSDRHVYLEPVIRAVRIEGEGAKRSLAISVTAPVNYKAFALKKPDRYVVDVFGAVLDGSATTVGLPEGGEVRCGQFELRPAISRIVIPLHSGVTVQAPPTGRGTELAFALGTPAVRAPAPGFPVEKLQAVTVENRVEGLRLVLALSGPVQYEWHRLTPPDHRFFLDIPKAVLVGAKQDLVCDDPFVEGIRVSQFQTDPEPVVRVSVDLKKAAEVRVVSGEGENRLVLEILHSEVDPGSLVLQGFGATAYPATGGVICIDPGHGGSDPGAVNRALGLYEKDVTLDLARRLAIRLQKEGWNVVLTRNADVDVAWPGCSAAEELGARVRVANDSKCDVFLSIHCNASANRNAAGTSLHVYKRSDSVLAQEIEGAVAMATGRPDRGTIRNRFYVLAHSNMPAVLVETAFLSNNTEGRLLADPGFRQRVAEALAQGLRQYASRRLPWAAAAAGRR